MSANTTSWVQNFFTSRDNNADGTTIVGQTDRLWYDPTTNTIRISDGVTPGGIIVAGGGSGGGFVNQIDGGAADSVYLLQDQINGGQADSVYTPSQVIDGGTALRA
jgi:hypothetical protein